MLCRKLSGQTGKIFVLSGICPVLSVKCLVFVLIYGQMRTFSLSFQKNVVLLSPSFMQTWTVKTGR